MAANRKEPPHSLVDPRVAEAMALRARATPPGCFLEVGVYHGGTAWHLVRAAEEQLRMIYLYDTFTGIPHAEEGDSHKVGDFSDASVDEVRQCFPYASVIPGIFPASAVNMGAVAFAHLDCDQGRSYREALAYLAPRMVKGGVIWCDDVGCLQSATRAVREFSEARGIALLEAEKHYLQF